LRLPTHKSDMEPAKLEDAKVRLAWETGVAKQDK
jgi:hypothetical protein